MVLVIAIVSVTVCVSIVCCQTSLHHMNTDLHTGVHFYS